MFRTVAFAICLSVTATALAKQPQQVYEHSGQFVGAQGCKSSSCHGGAGPKRSQFTTWTQQDFHSRAYAVLIDARSARIAETLGIAQAQSSARCTVCHSPFQSVAPARLTRAAHADEGVSCESCHGAANGWLRAHTRTDWNYRTRVGAGMRDLRSVYVRASACVACHQNLAPEVLSAGHPDLFFELDGQSVAEPKHWRDEETWSGARQWLTGQAVALREMSWVLAGGPQANAITAARWNGLAWLCAKITSGAGAWPPVNLPATAAAPPDFRHVQAEAEALAHRAASANWSEGSARTLLVALASTDAEFSQATTGPDVMGQRAKRLVLALDRLAHALNQSRGTPLKIEAEMKLLFDDVRTLDRFDGRAFAGHLQNLRVALEQNT